MLRKVSVKDSDYWFRLYCQEKASGRVRRNIRRAQGVITRARRRKALPAPSSAWELIEELITHLQVYGRPAEDPYEPEQYDAIDRKQHDAEAHEAADALARLHFALARFNADAAKVVGTRRLQAKNA